MRTVLVAVEGASSLLDSSMVWILNNWGIISDTRMASKEPGNRRKGVEGHIGALGGGIS